MKSLIEAIRGKLEEMGFKVVLNSALKGISGIEHRFELLAYKEENVVCVDIPNPSFIFLDVYGKAIDLPWVKILVPVKEDNFYYYNYTMDNLFVIPYGNIEEFVKKLEELLTPRS